MSTTPHTPPSSPNADRDSLVASYHAAQHTLADESAAPSPQVHTNVMAYAQQLAQARASQASIAPNTVVANKQVASANDGQWKIRALASVALFGFCGLLLMQWDRATPEEKQVAFSTQAPALATPAAPAPTPAPATAELSRPSNANPITKPATPAPTLSTDSAVPAIAGTTQSQNTDAANARAKVAAPKPSAVQDNPPASEAKAVANKQESRLESVASAPAADGEALRKDKAQKQASVSNTVSAPAIEASPPAAATAPASPAPTVAAAAAPQAAARVVGPRMSAPAPAPASSPVPTPAATAAAAPAPSPLADAASTSPVESSKKSAPHASAGAMAAPSGSGMAKSLAPEASAPAADNAQRAASPSLSAENAALLSAIRNKDAAALQQALANGANKDIRRNGASAVMQCVQTRQADLLKLLIAAGADVNATDAQGTTPLALSRTRGYTNISELLLSAGAK